MAKLARARVLVSASNEEEVISSRALTAEEQYYLEHAYKDPVESLARIEETAKFMLGATATTSGLFVAAFKLALGESSASGRLWFAPFILWAAAMLALVLVLLPQSYAVGRNEPAAWKAACIQARTRKYRYLCCGTALFVVGILIAALPLFL